MRMIRGFYNEQKNTVDVVWYHDDIIIRLDCGKWEKGLRTSPSTQRRMDALAVEDPIEYARLMLSGEMQMWLDAWDDCSVWWSIC